VKKKLFLLFILCHAYLYAENPSFKEIEVMPSSYAKDYYTWRFLQDKSTKKPEALTAYKWTKRKSSKLRKAIQKKVGYVPQEKKFKKKKDLKNYIIYPSTASKKNLKNLKKLYKKIQKQGKYSDVLEVMSSNNPFEKLAIFPAKTQTYILNGVSYNYRNKYFNNPFTQKQLKELFNESQFDTSIEKIVTNPNLLKLRASLLIPMDNNLSFQSNFLLAINAVSFEKKEIALKFLKIARQKTNFQSQFDQVDFWLYLVSSDKEYLNLLYTSPQVNLYTLSARDSLNKEYPKVIIPNLGFYHINHFDIHNPIAWEKIKLKMKKTPNTLATLAEEYNSSTTVGVYSYLKEKASKYQIPYYPMPYRDAMWGLSKERIAILYAIARQESRFIPASVSPSYALGMMQIMPFLIKHLAKERGEELDLNEMFDPHIALSYANQHMDYLNKWLYHPLFVAYAYNGGIGFTKKTIRKKHLFKKGKYEPYLSMELINNIESREYAKKVLANYVIYLNALGTQIKLSDLLSTLTDPSQTDRFRK